jgi:lipopolysaccharide heptosyltransferase II
MTMHSRPPKVVAVAPNWLGDAVMCLPAVALLARGGATTAVASTPYVARVFWGVGGVDEVWVDAVSGRLRRITARSRALRTLGADAVALFPPSFASAVPGFVAGVRHRVGFTTDARRTLLTETLGAPSRDVHLATSYAQVARRALAAVGLPVDAAGDLPPAVLRVSDDERAAAARLLGAAGVTGREYLVVVPGATFGPAKAWPRDRYRALCRRLTRDVPVVVCGGAGDRDACAEIADGVDGVVNLSGRTSLGEFFAVVESARALLANDSGAPHVAAALGVPAVVLFGSTSPAWTAPLGRTVEIMQHKVHCNPCYRRECPTQLECFHGIEVDAVWERLNAVLGAARDSSRRGDGPSDRIARARAGS